jgi:hypothetical protein
MQRQTFRDRLQAAVTASLHLPLRTSDYRTVKAQLEPADLALYRSLLPAPLQVPARPRVMVEFAEVSPTWHEGILCIACRLGEVEGWHGLYWAIDSYYPCKFGRLVGYPKFLADRMTLTDRTDALLGEVVHDGRTDMCLEFQRDVDLREQAADIHGPADELPFFLQVPPGRGPALNRLTYSEIVSPAMTTTPGSALVRFAVGQRLAGLLPAEGARGPARLLERRGFGLGFLYSRRVRAPNR